MYVCMSRSGYPPWILKRGALESSGQRLISSIGKTKKIAFFFHQQLFFLQKKIFKRWFFKDFSRFLGTFWFFDHFWKKLEFWRFLWIFWIFILYFRIFFWFFRSFFIFWTYSDFWIFWNFLKFLVFFWIFLVFSDSFQSY